MAPKRSKKEDCFGRLPVELLCYIISFLTIKEAIRTSLLSKRWYINVVPFMSNLDFVDCYTKRKSDCDRFMKFVDQILLDHSGNVDRFRLKCGEFINSDKVDGWIQYALKKKVKELDLWLNFKNRSKSLSLLPIGVFTCGTLESLKLDVYRNCKFSLKLPIDEIRFPCLKILHLSGIEFSEGGDSSIQRLFSSCRHVLEELLVRRCVFRRRCKISICSPILKRLTLGYSWKIHHDDDYDDDYDDEIMIDAPSLVYFKLCNIPKRILLKNLNSLVEADIFVRTLYYSSDYFQTYHEAAKNLFAGIGSVRTIRLSGALGKGFLEPSKILLPLFPKLTYLDLDVVFLVEWERVLPLLLACFPCIETLVLKVSFMFSSDKRRVKLPFEPFFLLYQLKTLKILSFEDKKKENLLMVEHLLKNAEVLENLIVQISPTINSKNPEKRRSKISTKLWNLPKVSKKYRVLLFFL